ncbi:DUF2807 domain-containing protein [Flavobacteriaceae bacterium]|nr:DUF2807 domain-containing protein [Flavobacteriaceae bacterium]
MRATILLLFILFSSATARAQNDPNEIKTLTTGPFKSLKVYSRIDVNLIESDVNKAVIYGAESDQVTLSVKNETLKIKLAIASLVRKGITHIDLYHSAPLERIEAHQGVTLSAFHPIEQPSIQLKSVEGSSITALVDIDHIDAKTASGGSLILKGSAKKLDLKVNTGGNCEAEQLKTERVNVKVLAGGYAYVNSEGIVDAEATAGGVVRIFGNPEKQIILSRLGGKILLANEIP